MLFQYSTLTKRIMTFGRDKVEVHFITPVRVGQTVQALFCFIVRIVYIQCAGVPAGGGPGEDFPGRRAPAAGDQGPRPPRHPAAPLPLRRANSRAARDHARVTGADHRLDKVIAICICVVTVRSDASTFM